MRAEARTMELRAVAQLGRAAARNPAPPCRRPAAALPPPSEKLSGQTPQPGLGWRKWFIVLVFGCRHRSHELSELLLAQYAGEPAHPGATIFGHALLRGLRMFVGHE